MAEMETAVIWNRLKDLSKLIKAQAPSTHASSHPRRNRYKDIVPYDRTRVVLSPPVNGADYVNASHVRSRTPGISDSIAAQAPHNEESMTAFWECIWQNGVQAIVCLANLLEDGRVKVHKYFPDLQSETVTHGKIRITLIGKEINKLLVLRHLEVTCRGRERRITHMQYTGWPDRGVPESSDDLIDAISYVRQLLASQPPISTPSSSHTKKSPLLVHCSAGVGRTGTFLALMEAIVRLEQNPSLEIDLYDVVSYLRNCRCNMVQTDIQLEFLHKAIAAFKAKMKNGVQASLPSNNPLAGAMPVDQFSALTGQQPQHPPQGQGLASGAFTAAGIDATSSAFHSDALNSSKIDFADLFLPPQAQPPMPPPRQQTPNHALNAAPAEFSAGLAKHKKPSSQPPAKEQSATSRERSNAFCALPLLEDPLFATSTLSLTPDSAGASLFGLAGDLAGPGAPYASAAVDSSKDASAQLSSLLPSAFPIATTASTTSGSDLFPGSARPQSNTAVKANTTASGLPSDTNFFPTGMDDSFAAAANAAVAGAAPAQLPASAGQRQPQPRPQMTLQQQQQPPRQHPPQPQVGRQQDLFGSDIFDPFLLGGQAGQIQGKPTASNNIAANPSLYSNGGANGASGAARTNGVTSANAQAQLFAARAGNPWGTDVPAQHSLAKSDTNAFSMEPLMPIQPGDPFSSLSAPQAKNFGAVPSASQLPSVGMPGLPPAMMQRSPLGLQPMAKQTHQQYLQQAYLAQQQQQHQQAYGLAATQAHMKNGAHLARMAGLPHANQLHAYQQHAWHLQGSAATASAARSPLNTHSSLSGMNPNLASGGLYPTGAQTSSTPPTGPAAASLMNLGSYPGQVNMSPSNSGLYSQALGSLPAQSSQLATTTPPTVNAQGITHMYRSAAVTAHFSQPHQNPGGAKDRVPAFTLGPKPAASTNTNAGNSDLLLGEFQV